MLRCGASFEVEVPEKTKATDISHPFLPALLQHPAAQLLGCRSAGGMLLGCVMLWSYGCGPRSKFCQLLMLSKLLNFPELRLPGRNTT